MIILSIVTYVFNSIIVFVVCDVLGYWCMLLWIESIILMAKIKNEVATWIAGETKYLKNLVRG